MTEEASIHNGLKTVYSINGVKKIGQIHAEKWYQTTLLCHTRINSKWIKDLNIRPETIKILQENTGSKILDIAYSNILSDISPQVRETKENINKWGYIKRKRYFTATDTNKIKTQLTKWENVFADTSNKVLICKIYEEHTKLNTKKPNNPIKKWAKDLDRHFSKEDLQMVNWHMKRFSISLIIREMQIKTTMRYHLTQIRMAIFNKSTNIKSWQGCRKRETLLLC